MTAAARRHGTRSGRRDVRPSSILRQFVIPQAVQQTATITERIDHDHGRLLPSGNGAQKRTPTKSHNGNDRVQTASLRGCPSIASSTMSICMHEIPTRAPMALCNREGQSCLFETTVVSDTARASRVARTMGCFMLKLVYFVPDALPPRGPAVPLPRLKGGCRTLPANGLRRRHPCRS